MSKNAVTSEPLADLQRRAREAMAIANGQSTATILTNLNTALAGSGVTAAYNGGKLQFTATGTNQASSISVISSGDSNNFLGLGSFEGNGGGTAAYTSITAGAVTAVDTQNVQIAIGGQIADLGPLGSTGVEATDLSTLNQALQGNALTRAASISAIDNGGKIELTSNNGTAFRLNVYGGAADGFGFGQTAGSVTAAGLGSLTGSAETGSASPSLDANGTATSGFLNFQGFSIVGNSQTVSLTAPDAQGNEHAISFSLSSADAGNIDAALQTINSQLQDSNDSTLQQIVAVKDQQGGADGIRFMSSLPNFDVSLGTTSTGTTLPGLIQGISNGTGTTSQGGTVITSSQLGTGSTADISTLQNAENAITALGNAVTAFGNAQAAIGKGENLFTYATNLAQSQVTSEAASESGIKDANLAEEASNLSKAQILVQAGTAALAQANSAPQAILSLLQHG